MMKVKICGITRTQDVVQAIGMGADYVGVILYPKSPRFVPRGERKTLLELAEGVYRVAVMVNPSFEEAVSALEEGFDLLQLHGDESLELSRKIGLNMVIKAFRVGEKLPKIEDDWKEAHAVLLDTYSKNAYGGTGKTFNWSLAKELVGSGFRVILSGGLNPDNVREAIEFIDPFGVDVSSGVEVRAGIKDKMKLEKFIKEAKSV